MKRAWLIGVAVFALGCSGGSSSGSPTAPSGGSTTVGSGSPAGTSTQSCRTYAATYTTVTTSAVFTSTVNGTCSFDIAANQTTCIDRYADTRGGAGTSTSVTSFASRTDVVDEVSVIPPLRRSMGTTTTGTGTLAGSSSLANVYDGQRRLLGESGPGFVTTYTAWDAAGRPTSATSVNGGQAIALTLTYNDAARSLVTLTTIGGGSQSCTSLFDANGINVSNACGGGSTQVTATTTVQSTQQVCR